MLRPYQVEATHACAEAWQHHRSILLVMATGTGKTFTGSRIVADRADHGRILWLAHRGELLDQAAETLTERVGLQCNVEKAELRAPREMDLWGARPVVVASVPTLRGRRLQEWAKTSFATIVVDEAHHAPAKTYRDILEHFDGAKVLGLTATPDRGDGTGMDTVFDHCAYEYDIRRGIAEGYLCSIQQKSVHCADLDISDVRTVAGDLSQGQLEQALIDGGVLHQTAAPLVELAGRRQTLVFTAGVAQAHALADIIAGYLGNPDLVKALDGNTPKDLRRKYIADFREGRIQFLLNCAVLTEGFDAPETACVAVARPTKSRSLYAQMIGRGTRIAEGKEDCIAEGQRVLTDHGMVAIEDVTCSMLVWDGAEFVSHGGAVCKGEQNVIEYAGLVATPDHKVWTEEGWKAFGQCAVEQIAIRVTESCGEAVRETDCRQRYGEPREGAGIFVNAMHRLRTGVDEGVLKRYAAQRGLPTMRAAATGAKMANASLQPGQGQVRESEQSPLRGLRWQGHSVRVRDAAGYGDVDSRQPRSASGSTDRSREQRRALRGGQPPVGDGEREPAEHTKTKTRVWDILNAGPRHRFTVEGLLVSNCLVLDFTGNSGRHRLVTPLDVLAGKPLDDDMLSDALGAVAEGKPSEQALQEAEQRQREREEAAADARRRAQKIKAKVAYSTRNVDPFTFLGVERDMRGGPASEKQLRFLRNMGVDIEQGAGRFEASKMIDRLQRRRAKKLCSYKQARLLARHGLPDDLSFDDARTAIDAIANNNWKAPKWLFERFVEVDDG